jgi:hypothetical protein
MASEGDPRVLFVMNLVLSAVFATGVVWGLDFVAMASFTPRTVVAATLLIMAATGIVTRVF